MGLAFITRWLRKQQRAMDMQMLWPECLEIAPDRSYAVMAFGMHVLRDPAWTIDYCEEALVWMLDCLEKEGAHEES